ncbi:ABC transporter ATP-binding protein/permease [Pseudoalteromonas luteoviolacea]|uniref:ABC transporter ATP-binding protein n=1 Tax=Pseudoalteromonas luteoviolacea TaxID=43657 RepID=UPI001F40CA9B|nr:ABC transporter ATP-binding protein [Pseudoalteromonas luteoviolacea]MCF6441321.1 ABC transporter ATP-binding protein/permease [Pseudoalteromonas luteoviolacea]
MDRQVINSIGRIFGHVNDGKKTFLSGVLFRGFERCIGIVPMMFCFYWLHTQQSLGTLDGAFLSSPVDYFIVLVAIFVAQLLCAYLGQIRSFTGSYQLVHAYRTKAINHFRRLPLGHIHKTHSSEFLELLSEDIKQVESIFSHVLPDLLSAATASVTILLFMLIISPLYALGLCAILPCAFWVLRVAKTRFNWAAKAKVQMNKHTSSVITDYIEALCTLKLYNQTRHWLARVQKQLETSKQHSLQVEMWGAGPVIGFQVILSFSVVLFVVMLALTTPENSEGHLNLSTIIFAMLLLQLLALLNEIAEQSMSLKLAVQSEQKVESLLCEATLEEPYKPQKPEQFDINFERVSFNYDDKKALEHISFIVPQGSVTAIVGETGSGKSTLINLCARFFEPQSGCITIGGIDLRDIGSEEVHNLISMVFQDMQLVDASILDNIRIGKPDATFEEVHHACEQAQCLGFINKLPNGLDTPVGEGGVRLSGGQRQRIAIARALLKGAPIVLLDEATASLDPITQTEVVSAIKNLLKDRTVITVAHRLSSIVHADNILVINEGKIVESGTHRCLLSIGGYYTRLWRAQSQAA